MNPNGRAGDRRALAVGAVVVAAIVLFGRGIPSLMARTGESSAASREVLGEYGRARGEVRALPAVRDSARARSVRLGDEFESLLRGRGSGGFVAALAAELNADADGAGLTLSGIDGRVDTLARGSFTPVTARVDAVGDVREIASFVATIESSDVRMRILELSVSQSDPAASLQQPEALRATLVVQGLARRPIRELEEAAAKRPVASPGGSRAP